MSDNEGLPLRQIPAVHRIIAHPRLISLGERYGRAVVKRAIEKTLDAIRSGAPVNPLLEVIVPLVEDEILRSVSPSLRKVINATGVILHTNLGRSPLAETAIEAVSRACGYSNLELDLETGQRGSRQAHVESLLKTLTGAEAALVVNNNAAAVLLVLTTLASGRQVIVSRGELVEIGGSFRVPDVMAMSGAILAEVGTTNKTRIGDYRAAIGAETAALLKVHPSNYRITGFTQSASLSELVALGEEFSIPVIFDAGSGLLGEGLAGKGSEEPLVQCAIKEGAAAVTFSGDKLLGGPQAGVIAGRADLVKACAKNPLARALRIDKLSLAALEATLRLYMDPDIARKEVPVLRMVTRPLQEVRNAAHRFKSAIERDLGVDALSARLEVVESEASIGGGSMPGTAIESWAVKIVPAGVKVSELARSLRLGNPAVIGRIEDNALIIDFRTVLPGDEEPLRRAVARVLAGDHSGSKANT